jgi:hypothetical protein
MADKSDLVELSDELIAAFGQMARGADAQPERVSNFYITADAATLVLAALVSMRRSTSGGRQLPALAYMDPLGHA